jgi:serine phosphatase RsbU (regulator of sigma subunit)
MQVRWYHSLAFKLFALMAILLLITTVGMSGKNILDFQRILKDQLFQRSLGLAENAMNSAENQVQNWQSEVNQTLRFVTATDAKLLKENVKSVIETTPDYLSLHVIRKDEDGNFTSLAYAFSGSEDPADYFGKDPKAIKKKLYEDEIDWVKQHSNSAPEFPIYIDNPSPAVKLSLIRIFVPAITGKQGVNWGVITVWQKSLTELLPKAGDMTSVFLDEKGRTLASANLDEALTKKSMRHYRFVRRAISGALVAGSDEIQTKGGDTILGTYSWSKRLRAGVVVMRNPKLAYAEITKQIVNTSILSFMVLLIAVLSSYHASRGITRSLRQVVAGTQHIAGGDFSVRLAVSKDELGILGHAVNHMSERIENLLHVQVEAARQEKELETAKTVQETLLPKKDRIVGPFSITGRYLPASECGGDWWGSFTTMQGQEFIGIADATGHGAAAALVTAMAFSGCMTLAKFHSGAGGDGISPGKMLGRLNEIMWIAGTGKVTMTFFAAVVDPTSGIMTYANAGHNFPMIIPRDPNDRRLSKARKNRSATRSMTLLLGGTPLGYKEEETYKEKTVQLAPGDRLFFYTDGLIECTNSSEQMWGKNCLMDTLATAAGQSIQDIRDATVKNAYSFFGGHPTKDDVTVVVAEMALDWEPQPLDTSA